VNSNPDRNIDARLPLAFERTFLAWVRTALAMMGFGFVVARFGLFLREIARVRGLDIIPAGYGVSTLMGTALVVLGIGVAAYATYRFRSGLNAVERGEPPLARSALIPTVIALALCGIGMATVWYLLQSS